MEVPMHARLLPCLVLSLAGTVAWGCTSKPDDSEGPEADADTDGDADTDTDGDADADSDADSDADADPDFCDDALPETPPAGPDCLSGTLACGGSITATTVGGRQDYAAEQYESWYCLVPWSSYAASERVYALTLPGKSVASVDLYSPCDDLDLIVLRWEDEGCPDPETLIAECEADDSPAGGAIETIYSDRESRYLVVVDGKNVAEDNFTLTVTCDGG
jgi:hypothetical protein